MARGGGKQKMTGKRKRSTEKKAEAGREQWMEEEEVPEGFLTIGEEEMNEMRAAALSSCKKPAGRDRLASLQWRKLTLPIDEVGVGEEAGLSWLEELDGSAIQTLAFDPNETFSDEEEGARTKGKKGKKKKAKAEEEEQEEQEEEEELEAPRQPKEKKKKKKKDAKKESKQKKQVKEKEEEEEEEEEEGDGDVLLEEVEYDMEEGDGWTDIRVDGVEEDDDYGDEDEDEAAEPPRKRAKQTASDAVHSDKKQKQKKQKKATVVTDANQEAEKEEEEKEGKKETVSSWRSSCPALDERLHRALEEVLHFKAPTPCQEQSVKRTVAGARHDLLLAAPTGSGKTLAFGLPILHIICQQVDKVKAGKMPAPKGPLCLIVAPTRELALQITSHLLDAGHYAPVRVVPVIGGIAIQKQERLLRGHPEIIVATPGRLWELVNSGSEWAKSIATVQFLVLDEADRMMSMGHFPELRKILGLLPRWRHDAEKLSGPQVVGNSKQEAKNVAGLAVTGSVEDWENATSGPQLAVRRHTFVCSATLSTFLREQLRFKSTAALKKAHKKKKEVDGKAKHTLEDLISLIDFHRKIDTVDVSTKQLTPDQLHESKILCLDTEKDFYLYYLLQRYRGKTMVFVNSIDCLRRIMAIFQHLRCPVYPMHAKMQQRQRLKNMDRFRKDAHCVLVSSDVTARGIDIPDVEHVVHYQLPRTVELYVHRSGRTARAASEGISVMLIGPSDRQAYKNICKVLGKDATDVPDFPVVSGIMRGVRKRLAAARALDKEIHSHKKKKSDRSWYQKAAEEMDIDLDDDLLSDDDDETRHRERKKHDVKVMQLKQKLNDLLRQPLLSGAASARYIQPGLVSEMDRMAGKTDGFNAASDLRNRNKGKKKR